MSADLPLISVVELDLFFTQNSSAQVNSIGTVGLKRLNVVRYFSLFLFYAYVMDVTNKKHSCFRKSMEKLCFFFHFLIYVRHMIFIFHNQITDNKSRLKVYFSILKNTINITEKSLISFH